MGIRSPFYDNIRTFSMVDSEETTALLEEARAGNAASFEQLLRRHRPRLRDLIQRRLNPKIIRRVDASDVIQETQIEAIRRRDDYLKRLPMPFSIWLLKTAHEQLLKVEREHLKTAKRSIDRELPLSHDSSIAFAQRFISPEETAGHKLGQQEAAQQLRKALAALPEIDREVVLLRNFESLSNKEASQVLDISEEATKKRYTRAILRLQEILHRNPYNF